MKLLLSLPDAVEKIIVGYSGGLDSHCLLHYLAQHDEYKDNVTAVYVNHHLSSNADAWQQHCEQICQHEQIPFNAYSVNIDHDKGASLEAKARDARYTVFAKLMDPKTALLTAHHQDDQAETLLLHLLRGSGIAGLAAMPVSKPFATGYHLRPLLATPREALLEYSQAQQLHWIDDESNQNLDYDRNYLRHEIIPRLRGRWPGVTKTFSRSTDHAAEALEILENVAVQDYQSCCVDCVDCLDNRLSIISLQALSVARQMNLLRYWLKQCGVTMPSTVHVQRIMTEVMRAKIDSNPMVQWQGGEVRRYQQQLYAVTQMPELENSEYEWDWQAGNLALKNGLLSIERAMRFGLDRRKLPPILSIGFRQGGEVMKLYPRKHHHCVKKLFQEWVIAPWQRDITPFIYAENTLIAIGHYGYNSDYVTDDVDFMLGIKLKRIF